MKGAFAPCFFITFSNSRCTKLDVGITPTEKAMSGKLNFSILVTKNQKGKKNLPLSTIFVKMGDTIIATRVTPGRYTEAEALIEFRKQPHLFKPKGEPYTLDILRRLAA